MLVYLIIALTLTLNSFPSICWPVLVNPPVPATIILFPVFDNVGFWSGSRITNSPFSIVTFILFYGSNLGCSSKRGRRQLSWPVASPLAASCS